MIPAEEVSTERAREAIPAEIPLADAVANVSAASRLVLGLQRADLDLVAARPPDRIHQPRRRDLYPARWSWSTRRGAGRPRGDDLRRRPDRPRLDHLAGRRQRRRGAGKALRGLGEVRRLPFTPHGADVPEL